MFARRSSAFALLTLVSALLLPCAGWALCGDGGQLKFSPAGQIGGVGFVGNGRLPATFVAVPQLTGGVVLLCYDNANDTPSRWHVPLSVATGGAFFPSGVGSYANRDTVRDDQWFATFGTYTGLLYSLDSAKDALTYPFGVLVGYQWLFAKFPYGEPSGQGAALLLSLPIELRLPADKFL